MYMCMNMNYCMDHYMNQGCTYNLHIDEKKLAFYEGWGTRLRHLYKFIRYKAHLKSKQNKVGI